MCVYKVDMNVTLIPHVYILCVKKQYKEHEEATHDIICDDDNTAAGVLIGTDGSQIPAHN